MACKHGATDNWFWETSAKYGWCGGLSTCECCHAEFGYIDSATYGTHYSKVESWTKNLCQKCEGHYEVIETGDPNDTENYMENHFI